MRVRLWAGRLRHQRATARGRMPTALGEVVLLVAVVVGFTRLHAAPNADVGSAYANAAELQSIERTLHLDVELASNRWLTEHPLLVEPAVLIYRLYYAILIATLMWVFLTHASSYLPIRRTFVAMTGLALVVFWALPVAPPRFALAGVIDIVAEHDLFGTRASSHPITASQLTAMPSLHVGWSAWCAYAVWSTLRGEHRRWAWLPWAFPLAMVAVVLATGNHYLLDVVGSVFLLAASIALAYGWGYLVERRTRTGATR